MADRIMFDGNDCPHTREPSVHGQPDPPIHRYREDTSAHHDLPTGS